MRVVNFTVKAGSTPFLQFRFGADIQALSLMEQIDWEELDFVGPDGEPLPEWEQAAHAEKHGKPLKATVGADVCLALVDNMFPAAHEEAGKAVGSAFGPVKNVMVAALRAAASEGCNVDIVSYPLESD